jgi:hypothetical protein
LIAFVATVSSSEQPDGSRKTRNTCARSAASLSHRQIQGAGRSPLGAMIQSKTKLQSRVIKIVTVGGIAQLYTDFEGTTLDALGKTTEVRHKAIEVLRRQPGGGWKLIVGDPNGRE